MQDILATSLSGIQNAQASALNSAQNLSHISTTAGAAPNGASPAQTPVDRVDISKEAINLMAQEGITRANAAVIRTADRMQKNVIDILG